MVERVDLGNHPVGLAAREVHVARALRRRLALDLGNQPGEVAQRVHGPVDVTDHAGERVARVHAVHQPQRISILMQPVGQTFEIPGALAHWHAAPVGLEGRAPGTHGAIHVGFRRQWHLAEMLTRRRVDGYQSSTFAGVLPLAADIQAARGELEIRSDHDCSPLEISD